MKSGTLKRTLAGFLILFCTGAVGANVQRTPAAVKDTFQTIMSELDQGGDALVVLNVDGTVQKLMDYVTKIVSAAPSDDEDAAVAKATVSRLKTFFMKNGFYAANGLGFSSVPGSNGMSKTKIFVGRDPAAAGLPLWRTISGGEPRKQMTLDFLPTDTAFFRVVDVVPYQVLQLLKSGINDVAPAEESAGFSNALAQASAGLGMNVENLIASIGDEIFLSVRLSSDAKIVIPGRNGSKIELPEPSLLLGCKVHDDSIMKLITLQLTKNKIPVTESKAGNTTLTTVNGLPPSPVPLQPTFALHGGCLLIGSTAKAVADAISAFDQKNGLATSGEFKQAFRDMPAVNNGMAFVSPRVFETIAAIQAHIAKEDRSDVSVTALFQSLFSDMLNGGGKEAIAFVMVNKKSGILVQGTMPEYGAQFVAGMTLAPTASIGMLAAIAIPSFVKARTHARENSCVNNLRIIDSAKEQYAMEYGGTNGMVVSWDNLAPFIRKDFTNWCFCPLAPEGKRSLSNYDKGVIGEAPKCLIHGKSLSGMR